MAGAKSFTESVTLHIEDQRPGEKAWTKLSLGVHRQVEVVRVRVKQIHVGSKFKEDVAVSEMRVVGEAEADMMHTGAEAGALMQSEEQVQQRIVMGHLVKNQVNLREKPSQNSASLGRYPQGKEFEVLGKKASGNVWWYKVEVDNKTGYFRSDMVEVENEQMLPQL